MNIKKIDSKLLDETSAKAKVDARLRMNYNIHKHLDEAIHRMLNALEPGTYIRPHRHLQPPKNESFVILRGAVELIIFDDAGIVIQREKISQLTGVYGMDLESGIWHTLIVLEPNTVIFEVKTGPFVAMNDKDFAPWSPEPEDIEGVKQFFQTLQLE